MKVILLKSVQKVGKTEDIVEVSEGFARNSLFPRGLAVVATDTAIAELKKKQSGRAADKAVRQTLLDKAIVEAAGKSLTYPVPANEQGNLFSKIDAKDIAAYLMETHRLDIDPKCIHLEGEGIKKTGEHLITIKDGSYEATLTITVVKK